MDFSSSHLLMCQPFPFNPSLLIILFNFWEPNVCLPRRHLHQQATHTKLYDTLMRTSDMNQVKWGKRVLAMSRHSSSYTRNDCSLNPRDPSACFYGCNFQRDYFPFAKKKKKKMKLFSCTPALACLFKGESLQVGGKLVCGRVGAFGSCVCSCLCAWGRHLVLRYDNLSCLRLQALVVQPGSSVSQGSIQSLYRLLRAFEFLRPYLAK